MKCVVLRISGGIGNQLFQYAHAVQIAKSNDLPLVVNKYYQNQFWRKGAKVSAARSLRIDDLGLLTSTTSVVDTKEGFFSDLMLRYRLYRIKAIRILYYKLFGRLYLDGYFQSESDFAVSEFSVPMLRKNFENASLLERKKNSCAIHVRAGDLLDQPWNQLCGISYYHKAIMNVMNSYGIHEFDVITENPEFAAGVLPKLDGVKYNFSLPQDEVNDFRQLASYEFLITANSTFSWWAAVLGKCAAYYAPPWFYKKGDKPSPRHGEFLVVNDFQEL